MNAVLIDQQDCESLLQTFLKTNDFMLDEYAVTDYANPFQGLVGSHYKLAITYQISDEKKSKTFFVKSLSKNPFFFSFLVDLGVYDTETFFYNLLADYEKYGIDTTFAPKAFFHRPYFIILEDLSGCYSPPPKFCFFDMDHCKLALEAVAKFHVASIIYERKKRKELQKELQEEFSLPAQYPKQLDDGSNEKSVIFQWMECALLAVSGLIDTLPQDKVSNDDFRKALFDTLSEHVPEGLIHAALHADLWTGNLMFQYEKGKPKAVKLVDYQRLTYGPVEDDIVAFLFTTTNRAFRKKNYANLINFYFRKFKDLVSPLGKEFVLPPFGRFLQSCENFNIPARIISLLIHSFTFHSEEVYSKITFTGESFRKFMYERRANYVIQSYHENELYRKVIVEDLLELRDLLFF